MLLCYDWTKVYTKKRPTDERTSVADNFCTIIIKVTKEIKAIPLSETQKIHNPVGIDVDSLTSFVFSEPFFEKLSNSFVSTLPELSVLFFDPLMERHSLEAHDYHASTTVRSMRSFSDVHLLDFVKLPLKSRENYETALGLVLQSHLKEYLSRFVVLLPGDWPSQFFPRQIVYRACSSDARWGGYTPKSYHFLGTLYGSFTCRSKCRRGHCHQLLTILKVCLSVNLSREKAGRQT